MAKAQVQNINNVPTLMINDKPYFGNAITISCNRNGELKLNEDYYRNLGESGIRIFFLICDTEFTRENAYEMFKKEAETIIRMIPDAYIIPRVGLHPTKGWTEAHPNAMIEWSDGVKRDALLRSESYTAQIGPYSMHSDEWMKAAGDALLQFCEKADQEAFGERIIGYFICAGSTSEWHPSMSGVHLLNLHMNGIYFDTSKNFKGKYQDYLDEKYGENKAEAIVPDMDAQYYLMHFDEKVNQLGGGGSHTPPATAPTQDKCHGSFPNPNNCRMVTDFYMAWGDATAKSILYFAQLVKKKWPDKLTGAFYAYTRWPQMNSGLSGVGRILNADCLDFCAAPGDYQNRQPGGWEALRAPADSIQGHRMLFFAEDDTRTHMDKMFYRSSYGVYDETDTENVMKRNFGKNLCGTNYAWWYDQHHGGGRFNSPVCFDVMRKQTAISKEVSAKGRYKNNEIAFVYDLESFMAVSHDSTQQSVTDMKNYCLGKIGAPYDEYVLDDLENKNMKDYKLYIFGAACVMDDKKIASIKKKLQKNHATALWLYGAGYINKDADTVMSCENIETLTGFKVNELSEYVYDSYFKICDKNVLLKGLQLHHLYGKLDMLTNGNDNVNSVEPKPYLCPLFYLDEKEEGIFGRFCEAGRGAAGIKEFDGFTSVWCGAKFVQYDFIRAVAQQAGCHIFSMDGDVVYEGSGYLTVHASSNGQKTIYLKEKCSPYEVYEGKIYGYKTDILQLDMYEGETKMFRLETGNS